MSGLDGTIIVAFALYAVVAGLRARRRASRSLEEYFLAGRTLSGWKAGISMAATQFAADTPLLVTGLIATAGVFSLWRLWIYAVAFLLLGFVLAPCWRRARVLTDAELAEVRYSGGPATALRIVKAIYFGGIFNCVVLAMVLFAAVEIAEPFLFWDQWLPADLFAAIQSTVTWLDVPFARAGGEPVDLWLRSTNNAISLAAIVLVTTLYSATGGLRSVVQTDLAQFGLMMLGTAAYAAFVVHGAGGLDAIAESLRRDFPPGGPAGISGDEILAFTPSRARDAGFVVLAVFALQWLVQMNADGTGYLAQRVMACRSDRDAKIAAVVFTVAQILLRSLLWLPIGLGLLVLFPPDLASSGMAAAEREVTFVRGIAELLPSGLRGLLLAALLAALASTLDTHLNWGASYVANDLYKRFYCEILRRRPARETTVVWVARVSNLLILGIALGIMTRLSSIQVAWQLSLLLGAGMGVPLVLRWLWWRINAWGEIGAIAASLALAPFLLAYVPAEREALRLLLMALASTGAGIAASLLTAPEPLAGLRAFYERVGPPGFWGPVGSPGDAGRLWRGLAATGLAALSIFALLTGAGSWLVRSPAPTWFPSQPAFVACLLVTGAALVPVWWRLGFSARRR